MVHFAHTPVIQPAAKWKMYVWNYIVSFIRMPAIAAVSHGNLCPQVRLSRILNFFISPIITVNMFKSCLLVLQMDSTPHSRDHHDFGLATKLWKNNQNTKHILMLSEPKQYFSVCLHVCTRSVHVKWFLGFLRLFFILFHFELHRLEPTGYQPPIQIPFRCLEFVFTLSLVFQNVRQRTIGENKNDV